LSLARENTFLLAYYYFLFYSHILGDDFPSAASLLETVLKLEAEGLQATASVVRDNPDSRSIQPPSASATTEGR